MFGNRWRRLYHDKYFSILRNSISTLAGYNPPDFCVFYEGLNKEQTGVQDMADSWWGKVIQSSEGKLLVNNSWSGSRVTKLPGQSNEFPSGCSEVRTNGLHTKDKMPDVILIYLGTNDWGYGVPPVWTDSGNDPENTCIFAYAYEKMLDRLLLRYPKADIWCCTLCESYISSNPAFSFPQAYSGIHIERFNDIIRTLIAEKQCHLIDLYRCHISYDSVDGSHPTSNGMETLAALMLRCMQKEIDERKNTNDKTFCAVFYCIGFVADILRSAERNPIHWQFFKKRSSGEFSHLAGAVRSWFAILIRRQLSGSHFGVYSSY